MAGCFVLKRVRDNNAMLIIAILICTKLHEFRHFHMRSPNMFWLLIIAICCKCCVWYARPHWYLIWFGDPCFETLMYSYPNFTLIFIFSLKYHCLIFGPIFKKPKCIIIIVSTKFYLIFFLKNWFWSWTHVLKPKCIIIIVSIILL